MRASASLLVAGFAFFAVDTANAQELGTVEPVPCPSALPWEGEEEGKTYDCSIVIVPENHREPGERTVELVVMRLKSTTLAPMSDPLVYLSGGPGASALHEITGNPILYKNMQEIRARRDVLVYDQRGTGHSQILTCGPFMAATGVVGELYPEVDIATLEAAANKAPGAFSLMTCAIGLKAAGVDLEQYNSVASAFDIATLVPALGYTGQYNLYGTSYGTRLALNAMRSTPENIRSVVLDGTVTPDTPNNAHTVAKIREHYDGVFAACERDTFCGTSFPDLRDRFIAVLEDLRVDPLMLDPPIVPFAHLRPRVNGVIERIDPAFFAVFGKLNNDMRQGGYAIFLPQIVEALEERDTDTLRAILGAGEEVPKQEFPVVATAEDVMTADDAFIAPALELLLALAARETDENERTLSGDFVDLVISDLYERLMGGEAQASVIKDLVDFTATPLGGTDRSALLEYVASHLSGELASTANAFIDAMSHQQVRDTMWAIQDVAEVMGGTSERDSVAMGQMFSVNCPEDIALVPEEVAIAYRDASPYPGLIVQTVEQYGRYRKACAFFGAQFTAEEMMSPVISDIPTLILQSALDTQTPLSLGRRALETLENGILTEWPSEGHVMAGHSADGCAGAIAASFLDQPMSQPNLSCMSSPAYTIPFETGAAMIEKRLAAK